MAQATVDLGRQSYWRRVLARWRRSGLSVRAFCRAEGVNEAQFYWWRRRLGRVVPKGPEPAFVPVHVVTEPSDDLGTRGIEVVLANGRCLRVGPGFDPQTLVSLVDLLEDRGSSC
jgi:hypothetical protein